MISPPDFSLLLIQIDNRDDNHRSKRQRDDDDDDDDDDGDGDDNGDDNDAQPSSSSNDNDVQAIVKIAKLRSISDDNDQQSSSLAPTFKRIRFKSSQSSSSSSSISSPSSLSSSLPADSALTFAQRSESDWVSNCSKLPLALRRIQWRDAASMRAEAIKSSKDGDEMLTVATSMYEEISHEMNVTGRDQIAKDRIIKVLTILERKVEEEARGEETWWRISR